MYILYVDFSVTIAGILGAFNVGLLLMLVTGWFADKLNAKWMLTASVGLATAGEHTDPAGRLHELPAGHRRPLPGRLGGRPPPAGRQLPSHPLVPATRTQLRPRARYWRPPVGYAIVCPIS